MHIRWPHFVQELQLVVVLLVVVHFHLSHFNTTLYFNDAHNTSPTEMLTGYTLHRNQLTFLTSPSFPPIGNDVRLLAFSGEAHPIRDVIATKAITGMAKCTLPVIPVLLQLVQREGFIAVHALSFHRRCNQGVWTLLIGITAVTGHLLTQMVQWPRYH